MEQVGAAGKIVWKVCSKPRGIREQHCGELHVTVRVLGEVTPASAWLTGSRSQWNPGPRTAFLTAAWSGMIEPKFSEEHLLRIDERLEAGKHAVSWDGVDHDGDRQLSFDARGDHGG